MTIASEVMMKGINYASYFLEPKTTAQKRYEAIRAVLVEEHSMNEVAEYFEVSFGTVRNWVSEFRRVIDCGENPPFSSRPNEGDHLEKESNLTKMPISKGPMCNFFLYRKDAG
jgi:transposase-like protein